MKFGTNVKKRREELGLSQKDLARAAKLSQTTISDIERGRNNGSRYLVDLMRALHLTCEELLYGKWVEGTAIEGNKNSEFFTENVAKIPISSRIPLIGWDDIAVSKKEDCAIEILHCCPGACSEQTFALRVVGDSMAEKYKDGSIIYVDPLGAIVHGCTVVVQLAQGTGMMRRFENNAEGVYLIALNTHWPDRIVKFPVDATIVGRVVGAFTPD